MICKPRPQDCAIITFGFIINIISFILLIYHFVYNRTYWHFIDACTITGYGTECTSVKECTSWSIANISNTFVESAEYLYSRGDDAYRMVQIKALVQSEYYINYTSNCWVQYSGRNPIKFIWSIDQFTNFANDFVFTIGIICIVCFGLGLIIHCILYKIIYAEWRIRKEDAYNIKMRELHKKNGRRHRPRVFLDNSPPEEIL